TLVPGGNCPGIGALSTTVGQSGASIRINGVGLTGVNTVRFGNVSATFTVVHDGRIDAVVPAAATTAPITVGKPGCPEVQSAVFTVCPAPPVSLQIDDGSAEAICAQNGSGDTFYVNRLTPAAYPATLNRVSI